MLKTLKDLFDQLLPPQPGDLPQTAEHALQLATAVLLVEVMRADAGFDVRERRVVLQALHQRFALTDDEAERLAELAEQTARGSSDLFGFTSRINERFDMDAKVQMVESLWRVALADGVLDEHERHLVWRIADLLHVPDGARVHARMRVEAELGHG
jgi:uncharacterized tellurite resistance protein B-like protein